MPDTFEVRDPQIEDTLREIGKVIDANLPPGWGFTLLLYEFGPSGATFYLSNADRKDSTELLREFIERQERNDKP